MISFCKIRTVKGDFLPIICLVYSYYTPNDIMNKNDNIHKNKVQDIDNR